MIQLKVYFNLQEFEVQSEGVRGLMTSPVPYCAVSIYSCMLFLYASLIWYESLVIVERCAGAPSPRDSSSAPPRVVSQLHVAGCSGSRRRHVLSGAKSLDLTAPRRSSDTEYSCVHDTGDIS